MWSNRTAEAQNASQTESLTHKIQKIQNKNKSLKIEFMLKVNTQSKVMTKKAINLAPNKAYYSFCKMPA